MLYPGAKAGPYEFPSSLPIADPLECLSFVAAGVDFATRGRRADEAIDVLRLLWAGDENGASFDGEFFSFRNMCSYPKPWHAPGLPVHVGDRAGRPRGALASGETVTSREAGWTPRNGTTRLVVATARGELREQLDQISALADRVQLR